MKIWRQFHEPIWDAPFWMFPGWITMSITSEVTKRFWRMWAGGVAYETLARESLQVVIQEDGGLALKTSSQLVVSVPPECTLLMRSGFASGTISLNVEGASIQSWDALMERNKHVITDP